MARLHRIAQVVESYSTTGDADLLCRVVARDHVNLEAVIQSVLGIPGVERTRSEIALSERVDRATSTCSTWSPARPNPAPAAAPRSAPPDPAPRLRAD